MTLRGATGLKVVEIGEGLSGAFAGLILALQGASVCQWRRGLNRRLDEFESAYYDRFRRLPEGSESLESLVHKADIVLIDLPIERARVLGLPLDLEAIRPGQVVVPVTSLGLDGPHSSFAMSDITDWAAGGLAYVTRRSVPAGDVEGYSPVLPPGRQPEILGGLAAAFGALWGVMHAQAEGSGKLVDVSRQEVQAGMLHGVIPPFVWNGEVSGSPAARLSGIGMLLPTADGQIYFRAVEPHQWQALIDLMGNPGWCAEPWFSDPEQRRANGDAVQALLGAWTIQHETESLLRNGQAAGVPFANSNELADVFRSPQLEERSNWVSIDVDGRDAQAPRVPLFDNTERTDEANEAPQTVPVGPSLQKIRVLDMGWSWAGPYAGMLLADAGAEVIKVESETRIDILRWSGAFADGLKDYERSGYYAACNRGKKSITLNLKHSDMRDILEKLLRESDVLIENFAPRVLPSLGFTSEELRRINPRLVIVSMSGYGATGPDRNFVSYGDHLLHASGIAAATGDADDPHTKIGIFYGDPVGGMFAATAALLGLRQRESTNTGVHVELSQLEGLVSLIPTLLMRTSLGETVPRTSQGNAVDGLQGFFRCAGEDAWVALAGLDESCLATMRDAVTSAGSPLRGDDLGSLREAIEAYCRSRSPWDVTVALQERGIAAYPVRSAPQLVFD